MVRIYGEDYKILLEFKPKDELDIWYKNVKNNYEYDKRCLCNIFITSLSPYYTTKTIIE